MTPSCTAEVLLLGDLDVATPLRAAGIPVTVVRGAADPARYSRLGVGFLPRPDGEDALVAALVAHARRAAGPTVLLVQDDHDLALVSRHRGRLGAHLALALPSPERVTELLDKAAFQRLADAHGLPVPPAQELPTAATAWRRELRLPTPVLLKPLVRRGEPGGDGFGGGKALVVHDEVALAAALARLAPVHPSVLAQQHIAGPEDTIETYHAHVGADGTVLAEFTGRKLRTSPATFGYSTALVTTDAADTRELGRHVVTTLEVRGPVKVDLKRGPDGRLWLLEVNARSNLWHRLGAVAGCDLPAVAVAELTGAPLPAARTARPGVTWSLQPRDLLVALAAGQRPAAYLRWLRGCDAVSGLRLRDPGPFLRGTLPATARRAVRRPTPPLAARAGGA